MKRLSSFAGISGVAGVAGLRGRAWRRWIAAAVSAIAALVTGGQAFAAITSMNTTNDASTITYAFQYATTGAHYHAYIDCDNSFLTGFRSTYGVGADYLIEDGTFFRSTGTGFSWSAVGSVTYTSNPSNQVVWTFPRTNLQATPPGQPASPCSASAASAKVVFEVTHPGATNEVSLMLTHTYLGSSSALTNDVTSNDATNVSYRVQYTGTWAFFHVFIDADQNPGTGYPVGGIGADYFVEGHNLHQHRAGTTGWDWLTPSTPVTFNDGAGNVAAWSVPRSAMAETQTDERADVVYHVQDSTNTVTVTLPKRTHYYFGGTGLPKPLPAQALVPLYVRPDQSTAWSDLLAAYKSQNPKVPTTVIAPTNVPDSSYASAITSLVAEGIHVAGYVDTSRGNRAASLVDADVDAWKTNYPNVDGIFYDLMNTAVGGEAYYQARTAHAKAKGFGYTIANPGQDIPPTYVGTVDTIMVYEHTGSTTPMSSWWASYPRQNFAVLAHDVSPMDTAFVSSAKQRASFIYLTDEAGDVYSRLSVYFSQLLAQLAIPPAP